MKDKDVINATTDEGVETVYQEGDITVKYEFRKLASPDMFLMFKILGKIGVNEFADTFGKENIQKLLGGGAGAVNFVQSVGIAVAFEMVNVILNNLPKCEHEIYQLLSNTSNLSVDEVKDLDMVTFTEMVIDFIKKPEFKDFTRVASKLFNK